MANWNHYQSIKLAFGVEQARIIAQFPKKWKQHAKKAVRDSSLTTMKQHRIIETLSSPSFQNALVYKDRIFLHDLEWIEDAIAAQDVKPFHAVIATSTSGQHGFVLDVDDLADNALFQCRKDCRMPRDAEGFRSVVSPLIEIADEIYFVDTYFLHGESPERRWANALGIMLEKIESQPKILRLYTQVHINRNETREDVISFFKDFLPDYIKQGLCLEVLFLEEHIVRAQADLHNRYVLTNRGGIMFPLGLDIREGTHDTVSLLSLETTQELYAEYELFSRHNKLTRLSVSGTRRI